MKQVRRIIGLVAAALVLAPLVAAAMQGPEELPNLEYRTERPGGINDDPVLAPRDDADTAFHFIAWSETGGIHQEAWRKFNGAQVGIDLDEDFRSRRTRQNRFLQDRKAMKLGDFTGLRGIPVVEPGDPGRLRRRVDELKGRDRAHHGPGDADPIGR